MIDIHRLQRAYQTVRRDLLAERVSTGHWVGELAASAVSTATAVSALCLVAKNTKSQTRAEACRNLVDSGVQWLVWQQNEDGGWGDTDKNISNIATTMLVRAALELAGQKELHLERVARADEYIKANGAERGVIARYGKDKTFAVPILTNYALAGLTPWKNVAPLPFEMACLPFQQLSKMKLPVVSYAIPALVAIGQARYFHRLPRNPVTLIARRAAVGRSLKVVERMQPESGGFLEAIPLTSFVIMSLASTGRDDHPIVDEGLRFIWNTAREDGSWPIDTNLATWVTSLSVCALSSATETVGALSCFDWLIECQHTKTHPFTQAAPGGWGWTDLSGAVPDVDDTSAAMLALRSMNNSKSSSDKGKIIEAVSNAARWLLDVQNKDGGWPTFCRGWGTMPFDRSTVDLTAHAIRALGAWLDEFSEPLQVESHEAIDRGFEYLRKTQDADGSWMPLWFGNQYHKNEENPVYGTARVLLAYRDRDKIDSPEARRGIRRLLELRTADGGWSGADDPNQQSTIEETAVALEALLADRSEEGDVLEAISGGLMRLIEAVEQGRYRETAPIGFYFSKLWYYEKLYPIIFTAAALGRAVRKLSPPDVESGEGSSVFTDYAAYESSLYYYEDASDSDSDDHS